MFAFCFMIRFMIVLKQHLFFSNNLRLLFVTASDCSCWTSRYLDTLSGHPSERGLGNFSLSALESSTLFPDEICAWFRKKHVAMARNFGYKKGTHRFRLKVPEMEDHVATAELTNHWDTNGQELCWWANALGSQLLRAKQAIQETWHASQKLS